MIWGIYLLFEEYELLIMHDIEFIYNNIINIKLNLYTSNIINLIKNW